MQNMFSNDGAANRNDVLGLGPIRNDDPDRPDPRALSPPIFRSNSRPSLRCLSIRRLPKPSGLNCRRGYCCVPTR